MVYILVIAIILGLLFGFSVAGGFLSGLFYGFIIFETIFTTYMALSSLKKVFTETASSLRWDAFWDTIKWTIFAVIGWIAFKFFIF